MIKIILLAALAISATALGTASACSGTLATSTYNCSMCSTDGSSNSICAICNAGLSLPSSATCVTLNSGATAASGCTIYIQGCNTCASSATTTCTACNSGYWLTSNGTCLSCSVVPVSPVVGTIGPGCATCTPATSSGVTTVTCNTCGATGSGYASATSPDAHAGCINCATGVTSLGGASYTTASGFLLGGPGGSGCTPTVSATGTITAWTYPAAPTCVSGYMYDSATGSVGCASCMTGKVSTAGSAATPQSVTYTAGYNAACLACQVSTTASTLQCTSCQTGTVLDSATVTATACVSCSNGTAYATGTPATYTGSVPNCAACSLSTHALTCTSCVSGYGLMTPSGGSPSCVSCSTSATGTTGNITGCSACSVTAAGAITCNACNSGYYFLYNSTCGTTPSTVTTDPNCVLFSAPNHCVTCSGVTAFSSSPSNACISCPSNCAYCSSSSTCTACNTGYKLSSTTAGTCTPNGANMIVPGFALLSIIFYFLF